MFRKQHEPSAAITVTIDGVAVTVEPEETVAAVLLRTPPFFTRTTSLSGEPRGPYCMMGVCFDCLAVVDETPSIQTCLTLVRDGMKIERQHRTGRSAA